MKYLIAVFLLCCSMQYAAAAGYTGNDLKDDFAVMHGQATIENGIRTGYVMGFIDGIAMQMVMTKEICLPQGFKREQSLQIVKNFLNTAPQFWTYQAAVLVRFALHRALPCK